MYVYTMIYTCTYIHNIYTLGVYIRPYTYKPDIYICTRRIYMYIIYTYVLLLLLLLRYIHSIYLSDVYICTLYICIYIYRPYNVRYIHNMGWLQLVGSLKL